jgi:hypothetical protein
MRKPPTKKLVATELPLMLSNSFIFVVKSVMLLIPMNPINKQIKLETKARTNHSANENRNSAANLKSPRQKITLGSKYNAFSARHYSAPAGVA